MSRPQIEVEDIYRQHSTAYYNYLLRLTRNPVVSQDLLQEAFLKMTTRIGTLRDSSLSCQWGYRIVLNCFRDWYRKFVREERADPARMERMPDARFSPDGLAGAEASLGDRILSLLEIGEREIFVLSQYQKMTYDRISAATGIPERTVRRRMKSALDKISGFLREARVIAGEHCDFGGRGA